jgi:hypothetical protein
VIHLADGVNVALLPEADAEQVWDLGDAGVLLKTAASPFSDGAHWIMESSGHAQVPFGIFGADALPAAQDANVAAHKSGLLFREYLASVEPVRIQPEVTKIRDAGKRGPMAMGPNLPGRTQAIPMAPEDVEFENAAVWTIHVRGLTWSPQLADALLRIDYQGDVARVYQDGKLVDDNFWNGLPWELGLREISRVHTGWERQDLQLRVLPLPEDAPMFFDARQQLRFEHGVADALSSIEVIPQYRIVLAAPVAR